jgi:hypothetical protein
VGNIDINLTMNVTLVIYLVTYLFVNGFLIYLLVKLRNALRGVSRYSQDLSTFSYGVDELKAEMHRISAQELTEIDELKQSLFDIQNTTARQLSEISKLGQSLSGTPTGPGANSGSGSTGVRIARSGMG